MNADPRIPRFSEGAFRTYEPLIASIVDRWPDRTIITPQGRSCETVTCRLRDAFRSLAVNRWKTTIDLELAVEIQRYVQFWHDGKRVFAGRKKQDYSVGTMSDTTLVLQDPPTIVVRAALSLASHGVFQNKPIEIKDASEEVVQLLSTCDDENLVIDRRGSTFTVI